jgi:5,10-methylenetetrahydrofolate reductase
VHNVAFREELFGGRFPVALEITPPLKPLHRVLLRRARLLDGLATAVNVIQRPGRQSSLDASVELVGAGIEPVWHLAARGTGPETLAADFARARDAGIAQVLCVLGDSGSGPREAALTVREIISVARDSLPGALLGATLNQYVEDRAGARYVQTQPVFAIGRLREAVEPVRESADVLIVPMVMPLLAPEAVKRMESRLGVALPAEVHMRVASGLEAAWELFDETVATLAHDSLADGVAVMTFETDPSPETAARIVESFRCAGVAWSGGGPGKTGAGRLLLD